MIQKTYFKTKLLSALLLIMTSFALNAQKSDSANGYNLFKTNCSSCHTLDAVMTGPALRDVGDRRERAWLQSWIKDNVALRATGDAYANKIFNEFKGSEMTQFKDFSEESIDDIIAYLSDADTGKSTWEEAEKKRKEAKQVPKGSNTDPFNRIIISGFVMLFGLLLWLLYKVNQLVKLSKPEELRRSDKSFLDMIRPAMKFLLPVLLLISLFGAWKFMLHLGVDKGYQPEQPIYFSHKIHAGDNQIDCQYCHSSAKYGKVSGIPSTNVCLNCHKTIKEYTGDYIEKGKDREFYNAQIQKLYEYAGTDGTTVTGEGKPLKWVRIHNMPDFVYFNHSQHITAGEQAIIKAKTESGEIDPGEPVCFACHGKVDEMDEVKMANDFTMGWCIGCHRTTEVDMNNKYNAATFDELHARIKAKHGEDAKLTVDAIGGMECAKCHY